MIILIIITIITNKNQDVDIPTLVTDRHSGIKKYLREQEKDIDHSCLLYTSPSPRDGLLSRMPSSA